MIENNYTIALLIDAENISHSLLDDLEEQLTMLGRITVKKCYGDFSKKNMNNWSSEFINKHALEVVQQHAFTKGKNSSDIRLAIDAMDILYEKNINAICIMSSDSDFTGLAIRLKKSSIYVWGAGEEKTPAPFINVCDRFFTLGNTNSTEPAQKTSNPNSNSELNVTAENKLELKREEILQWVSKLLSSNYINGIDSGSLATTIRQRYPDFEWSAYGVKKFPDFFTTDSKKRFEIKKDKGHSNITILAKES